MRCQLVFNNWESRAFIAKSIISYPLLQKKLKNGVISIARGITNAFILHEMLRITGNPEFEIDIDNYVAGIIDGSLWVSNSETRTPEVTFFQGTPQFIPIAETIHKTDLIIKGANVIGTDWLAGVLCGHPHGGTIGSVYPTAISRGIPILIPVSIEKMIPFPLKDIIPKLGGQNSINYARGMPTGVFPVVGGKIFTEIEAIKNISNRVDVFPIGSGGVFNGAGATIFELLGLKEDIEKIIRIFEDIKNTQPLKINIKPH